MVDKRTKERHEREETDLDDRLSSSQGRVFVPTSFKIPEGVESFRFRRAGKYTLDIVQFEINHRPILGGAGNIVGSVGKLHWELPLSVHRKIGPKNGDYCCLWEQFQRNKCPVCQELNRRMISARDETERKSYRSALGIKNRQMFKFWDTSDRESREKGVQIYEASHYMGFGELLNDELKIVKGEDPNSPFLKFFSRKKGCSLVVHTKEEKYEGRPYFKPHKISFVERRSEISDEMIDAISLSDLPIELPYDELEELVQQTGGAPQQPETIQPKEEEEDGDDEGGDDDPPSNGKFVTARAAGIVVGAIVDHDEFGPCKVTHISTDGTSLKVVDDEGEKHVAVSVEDVRVVEDTKEPDGKEDPSPKVKKISGSTSKKGSSTIDPDDEDSDEEDEDDDMPKRNRGKKK